LSPFALETLGGHAASTLASVYHRYLLLTKQMRDSGLPADALLGKFKKDISFALRRGTIAQVTTHHHALDGFAWLRLASARSSAEDEELLPPALNRRAAGDGQAGWDRETVSSYYADKLPFSLSAVA
jgi:hypothetical protein